MSTGNPGPHGWKENVTMAVGNATVVVDDGAVNVSIARPDGSVSGTQISRTTGEVIGGSNMPAPNAT